MPELSIIIPVFRAECFLNRCIDSVLNQTFSDYELILINDGSPDRSGEICDEYAKRDPRITVYHQQNLGVSAARNAGLKIASGRFLTFVDSDDAIECTAYEEMIKTAKETNAEIVCCGVKYYSEIGEYKRSDLTKEFICNRDEMLQALYERPDPLGGSCCNKVFRRDIVSGIEFHEDVTMGEDWLYLFETFKRATLQYKLPGAYYCVTEHKNSSARKKDVMIPVKILKSSKKMMLMGQRYSPAMGIIATDKYLDDSLRYMKQIRQIGQETRQPFRRILFKQKTDMAFVLAKTAMKKVLPKEKLHGYLYGLINT